MLAKTGGNLGEVYRETERQRISRAAEDHINEVAARATNMDCELEEGQPAAWYLVHTFPGDDLKAMRYLARRRFGVFRPMQQRKESKREGQPVGGMEATFPGWLFVYCWDIGRLRSRVLACPGVMGLFCYPVSHVPVAIDDEFVQRLRAKAWNVEEGLTHVARQAARHEPKRQARRPTTKERKLLDKLRKDVKRAGIEWDQSTWDTINGLEPHLRIAFMQQTVLRFAPVAG